MGAVYLGHDPQIGRAVAIKTMALSREFEGHELAEARARFFREAEMAGRLHHPDIVAIFDAGEEAGLAFIAMEYVKGHDLLRHTLPGKLLPVPVVLDTLARVALALAYAHTQGVVHCDVKPANILVAQNFYENGAVLIDFGNARRLGEEAVPYTTYVTASLPYSPPELLTGAAVTGATDVYALACTAVEMITGSPPFTATNQAALADSQLHRTPPRPSHDIDWLPRAFDSVLAKAMAKRPEGRYQSCTELVALVTRIVRD